MVESEWGGMMSPAVDETAGDLPVRDVGLMRGGLMPTVPGLCVHITILVTPQIVT